MQNEKPNLSSVTGLIGSGFTTMKRANNINVKTEDSFQNCMQPEAVHQHQHHGAHHHQHSFAATHQRQQCRQVPSQDYELIQGQEQQGQQQPQNYPHLVLSVERSPPFLFTFMKKYFASLSSFVYLCLFLQATKTPFVADAFSSLYPPPPSQKEHQHQRYFTYELVVPPLAPEPGFSLPAEFADIHCCHKDLPITYTNNPKTVSDWLSQNVPSTGSCSLGFDMESVPDCPWLKKTASFYGPATIQLATTDAALVIHLAKHNGRPSMACAPLVEAVLRDEFIVKAGCSIDMDILELREHRLPGLEAFSRLDLGGIGYCQTSGRRLGLQSLVRSLLGLRLPKSKTLARSNWSQLLLSDRQIEYAARDAWAGAAIVAQLAAMDSKTFGTEAILQRLQTQKQTSIKDFENRVQKRRQARTMLADLLAPYKIDRKNKSIARGAPLSQHQQQRLPSWKFELVRDLQAIVRNNRLDRIDDFDIEIVQLELAQISNSTF